MRLYEWYKIKQHSKSLSKDDVSYKVQGVFLAVRLYFRTRENRKMNISNDFIEFLIFIT